MDRTTHINFHTDTASYRLYPADLEHLDDAAKMCRKAGRFTTAERIELVAAYLKDIMKEPTDGR